MKNIYQVEGAINNSHWPLTFRSFSHSLSVEWWFAGHTTVCRSTNTPLLLAFFRPHNSVFRFLCQNETPSSWSALSVLARRYVSMVECRRFSSVFGIPKHSGGENNERVHNAIATASFPWSMSRFSRNTRRNSKLTKKTDEINWEKLNKRTSHRTKLSIIGELK